MTVAVLGLGEAGRVFAQAFLQSGEDVVGFDPGQVETPDGVTRAATAAEAVESADMVIALTTARFALSAASECREALPAGSVYLDLNAGSPTLKEKVAETLEGVAEVADGAVIGSVRTYGAGVEVLLSGGGSVAAAEKLRNIGTRVQILEGGPGAASGRKLLRSVFMKGLGALVHEAVEAGAAAGEEEWVREQIAEALVGGHETLHRLHSGIEIHARRRGHELADSLQLLGEHGGHWPVTRAAQERHLLLARRNEGAAELIEALGRVPTAAIGDGGDRLGFVGSSVRPVWPCPQVAGPALTVQTQDGDNYAIHQALKEARPGDVIVVCAETGAHRALIGELIAERAVKKGIAGMILGGPVRDAAGIEAAGLPVWATGLSAAGPYKNGPARLGDPVAIGNAVCRTGDIAVADGEGIVFLPPERASAAVEAAEAVLDDEARRLRDIREN